MNESSCCFRSLPVFGVVSFLDLGHSNRCAVVSHCHFNLKFPEVVWCLTSFHMIICHLYTFYLLWGGVFSALLPILNIGLFVFLLLNFKSSLYILNSLLLDGSFTNIFSQSLAYLFILLMLPREVFDLNEVQLVNEFIHGSCFFFF